MKKIVSQWIESSDKDYKTMMDLYITKNNNWALFMGHLVLEKLLKALYVKNKNEFPPMIHDLRINKIKETRLWIKEML